MRITERFKNIFNAKPRKSGAEKKYFGPGLFDNGRLGLRRAVSPAEASEYYNTVAPLYTAIDMIASAVSGIEPLLEDVKTGDITYSHPALDLLRTPNAFTKYNEFITQCVTYYLLTGNLFIVATGPVNRPPLELHVINPSSIHIDMDEYGFPLRYNINSATGTGKTFSRKETGTSVRFFAGAESEIIHIKTFSVNQGNGSWFGMSPLEPIINELDQYVAASVHNLSILNRGARPSGALLFEEDLTDEQFQNYQMQLDRFYRGGENAGRVLLLENKAKFQELSQNNRDMDFATLKRDVTLAIYSAYRIPIPLVNAEFSSYDNLKTSTLNFYDQAVLPLLKRIYSEITALLVTRYGKSASFAIVYDQDDVEALSPRKVDTVTQAGATGVITVNEARTILGYAQLAGGDVLLVDGSKVTLEDLVAGTGMSLLSEQE